jgi:hypothetical protein
MELVIGAILAVLSFILGVVFRPYFTGYATKKGENLATHEDIDKLVDQVKAVTEATKKIETEMSSGFWDKQKRWEMKREVLFEAARRISEIDEVMLRSTIVLKQYRAKEKEWEAGAPSLQDEANWKEVRRDAVVEWRKTLSDFDVSRAFVLIVCSPEAAQAFIELGTFLTTLAAQITEEPNAYDTGRTELYRKILLAQRAIRKELEVDA